MRNIATILIQQAVAVLTSFTFRQRLRNSAAVLKRLPSREQARAQKLLNRLPVNFMRRPWGLEHKSDSCAQSSGEPGKLASGEFSRLPLLSTYQLLEHPKVVGWAEGFGAGWRCAADRG